MFGRKARLIALLKEQVQLKGKSLVKLEDELETTKEVLRAQLKHIKAMEKENELYTEEIGRLAEADLIVSSLPKQDLDVLKARLNNEYIYAVETKQTPSDIDIVLIPVGTIDPGIEAKKLSKFKTMKPKTLSARRLQMTIFEKKFPIDFDAIRSE